MRWIKAIIGFISIVVILGLITYYILPFNSIEFASNIPGNSNFTLNSSTASGMQFYPDMRYPSSNISYSIDKTLCSLQKQDDMRRAFDAIENATTLRFYSVNSNPEISISCDDKIVINQNYFIAGEGGPVNITKTDNFNVILNGEVLLLRDSNCPNPNIEIHELLHALGFSHSQNPNNVMYPVTDCSQTIGQDIPDLLNKLYSAPAEPDLSFGNASAIIHGHYLDANITLANNGLADSGSAMLIISVDNSSVEKHAIDPLAIGEGITYSFTNIWIPAISPNEVEMEIQSNFSEISKGNNKIKLEIK
ncbi:MAG: matrixin family metalloprotease [Nanoarchaeota archaeon]|nr:matrixin family metalloprotease [Nanoarchaeota archaeon]